MASPLYRSRAFKAGVRVLIGLLVLWVAGAEVSAALHSHPLGSSVFGNWPVEYVQFASAGLCILGAFRRTGPARLGWLLIGIGIVVWTLGDVYWLAVLDSQDSPPTPSPADGLYLLFVPCVFVGLIALMRAGCPQVRRAVAIDGVIVALAAATVSTALVIGPVAHGAAGGTLAVATNLAYPVTDFMLLGMILGAITLRGWRFEWSWVLLAAGTLVFWASDSIYVVTSAHGTYATPNLYEAGWPLSAVLYGIAAWSPRSRLIQARPEARLRDILLPTGFAFAALVVALLAPRDESRAPTVVLCVACIATVMIRLLVTWRENIAVLEASRQDSVTDALTDLRNRRALTTDLEAAFATADDARPAVLVLFDLDGFKHYNDTYGHSAGDALLVRLGRRLERAISQRGRAYRIGGDEFCVLLEPHEEVAQSIVDAAVAALSEQGEGFRIGSSHGTVVIPREASTSSRALVVADQRMYADKARRRPSADRQSIDVLLRALDERDPDLGSHVNDVAALAEDVARHLGLAPDQVTRVRQAAELHDVGKVAIPDAILNKPGPLDAEEWKFVRNHTLIGERIILAAPTLEGVGKLVRSSHERFDGGGYPDRLAGLEIPLGSRIVAVCDAFDAMTSRRTYRLPMGVEAALVELRACAGTQFDPVVVEAFVECWSTHESVREMPQATTAANRQSSTLT